MTGTAGPGTPTGTIPGYILDPHGLAVRGARVIVDSVPMAATPRVIPNEEGHIPYRHQYQAHII